MLWRENNWFWNGLPIHPRTNQILENYGETDRSGGLLAFGWRFRLSVGNFVIISQNVGSLEIERSFNGKYSASSPGTFWSHVHPGTIALRSLADRRKAPALVAQKAYRQNFYVNTLFVRILDKHQHRNCPSCHFEPHPRCAHTYVYTVDRTISADLVPEQRQKTYRCVDLPISCESRRSFLMGAV